MRIIFIGHPGSGKTYAADLLSVRTRIEKIDIDVLFDKHPFYFLSKKLYKRAFNKLFENKKEWIVDGYHGRRMPEDIWRRADLIIFIDLPKQELKRNILNRYGQKRGREFSHWQSIFANNLKNFGQIYLFDRPLREKVQAIKSTIGSSQEFIVLKSRQEIQNFIDGFKKK